MKDVIKRIVDEGDRVLLFFEEPGYHVIAPKNFKGAVGDTVAHEPFGANFGFLAEPK